MKPRIPRSPQMLSLAVLVVTSFTLARTMFLLIPDPEGPNLLVVSIAAAVIFGLSTAGTSLLLGESQGAHHLLIPRGGLRRLFAMIVAQACVTAVLYIFLK